MNSKNLVLVVDDDPLCCRMLDAVVKSLGYDTIMATNGHEALDKAAKLSPDVILLDVMMPGLSGFEVCERIRASALLREIPVILVTTLADQQSRIQGLEAGADEFISKPYDQAELEARLKNIVKLNRYRRILSARVQLSWVLGKASEGYLMLSDDDAIHYANPAARRLLALKGDDAQAINGTFSELARRQYYFEPAYAWLNWPNLSDPLAAGQRRFLAPLPATTVRTGRLQVEMINFPSGWKASRLVRLEEVKAPV